MYELVALQAKAVPAKRRQGTSLLMVLGLMLFRTKSMS
jgi:hypothetical protein